jgi:CRP-like cAMP-binding protein
VYPQRMDEEMRVALSRVLGEAAGSAVRFERLFSRRELEDGEIICRPGQLPSETALVLSGVARHYVFTEDGRERTTDFCRAGEFTGNAAAPGEGGHWIAAVGRTSLAVALSDALTEAAASSLVLQSCYSRVVLSYLGLKSKRESELLSLDPAGRYEAFVRDFPDLLDTVPQYLIASYLGIAPETLSRIRNRRAT